MSLFYKIFAVLLSFFIYFPSGQIASYAPLDKDNLKFNFTVISDGHMEGNNSQKHKNYGEGFRDMASAEVISRALVMVGDNTMNGQISETAMLYGLMDKYNKIDNVLMAVGNHEISGNDYNKTEYARLKNRFITFNNTFLDHKIENLWHSQVIDGYHFIILGSDRDDGIQQYLSPEQLEWLDAELKSAAESGKPAFVFSHWPLNHVFSGVWYDGHVGEQSEELRELLKKYDNRIFFFTGHLHMGIFDSGYGIKKEGNITYLNVPSFGSENTNGGETQNTGMGFQVEVYENELVVRVRNFVSHEWTKYEYHFDI